MKLIIAQGNPGTDYAKTRHNIAWQVADALAGQAGASFQAKPKFLAEVAEYTAHGEKVIIIKPQTFYNETGRAARALADFYKVASHDILALHDELALPLGTLRLRQGGSDAGNNGVKSLNAHLANDFWRLRLGIGSEQRARIPDADFVLSRFTPDEQSHITAAVLPEALRLIAAFLTGAADAQTIRTA
ncbi:MAG: aminoacyl-tRNA hydrolase [Candidatus Saccharibacteria bacterium]|nr:aminoacyl-tRNA hydrolase [Candidatus Saccharibacteria bacterium]